MTTTDKLFCRGLTSKQMNALAVAAVVSDHWWRDLLSLWKPSGVSSGEYGLRLAVRHGYLNFYRHGQSVAKVSFDGSHRPTLSVHAKYICNDDERGVVGQVYARLDDRGISCKGLTSRAYEGLATVKAWIDVVNRHYAKVGGEKPLIDQLLDNPANDGVIDLEMGLPAWGSRRTAPRMDVVAVEEVEGTLTVIFGEVKRIDDGRVRSSKAEPEVVNQLKKYENYLTDPTNRDAIANAYSQTAISLLELAGMARSVGAEITLSDTIRRAATTVPLNVARQAVLVILRPGDRGEGNWEDLHRPALNGAVKFVEVRPGEAMNLGVVV
ncbi:hypothetical protein [Brevundimonas vesicularis]|jgi:hypothetical protein|uniref:hypothetical protein n=1 Tax=Brevundimonas vesicularis TaxID=41276 RepID=UPI00142F32B1|nr:hypothetical protein [Brevundimonas vesicularis]